MFYRLSCDAPIATMANPAPIATATIATMALKPL